MPYASPACFRAGEAEAEAAPRRAAALATSVYETRVGIVALSWSRSRLGLSLRVDLLLSPSDDDDDDDDDEETLRFRIRPWLLWKRRGSKRFPLKRHARRRRSRFVDLAWDLTRARFSDAAAPEPAAGYFVSVAVDGEVVLVAGPSAADHHRGHPHRHRQTLISRREHVVIGGRGASRAYRTTARLGGREREIAMELGEGGAEKAKGRGSGGEVGMLIMVDGNCVLHVPRVRWTFRGSATVSVAAAEGGGRIRVSWDLHNWLFRLRSYSAPAPTAFEDAGDAVFVFQFEPDEDGDTKEIFDKEEEGGDLTPGTQFSCRWRRKKSLLKASSSSSASSASSASTSSVAGWASPEEAEMQRGDAFSLLVYAWRN